MKVHYSKIYPKKRFKDMVIDHYYDMTAGDFLTDEDCRDQELLHIKSVLMRPLNLPQLPFASVVPEVYL